MNHTVTLNLDDDVFEPIASGAAQIGISVEDWIERRLRMNLVSSDSATPDDDRMRSVTARARKIVDRLHQRNAHRPDEEIAKSIDDAVSEVRRRG